MEQWNFARCKKLALKCRTRKDLKGFSEYAYNLAYRNGWFDKFDWLVPPITAKRWTAETCRTAAEQCSTYGEFKRKFPRAYTVARKNGWLYEYPLKNYDGIWSKQTCMEAARQCKTKKEFRDRFAGAYAKARKCGYYDSYTWLASEKVLYTYDECKDAAKKCKTRQEYRQRFPAFYDKALRRNWIDDFDWLERSLPYFERPIDTVYAYIFKRNKAIYIGRSVEPEIRDQHHRSRECPVGRYAEEHRLRIPPMTVLRDGLTLNQGLEYEDRMVREYREAGWHVINTARTGVGSGAIGQLGAGKWTYENCYNAARKYNTVKDFWKQDSKAYNAAYRKGWLVTFTWLAKECHMWTFEECYNEASKYELQRDFRAKEKLAYNAALKHDWLKHFTWLKHVRREWTYDSCYAEAKKYSMLQDFRHYSKSAYIYALRHGYLDDYDWLERLR